MSNQRLETALCDVGRNMRRLRLARKLTQKGAAALARMHWRHWQKLEAAEKNVTMATLAKIATALDVEIVELLRPAPRR